MVGTTDKRHLFRTWVWGCIICTALIVGVVFWSIRGIRPVHTFVIDHTITIVRMSPDNQYIVAAGKQTRMGPSRVFIWQTATQQLFASFTQEEPVTGLAISPDTSLVAIVTEQGRLIVWSLVAQEVVYTVRADAEQFIGRTELPYPPQAAPCRTIESVAFHPQGSYLAVGCLDGVVVLVHPSTGARVALAQGHQYTVLLDQDQLKRNAAILDLKFSPDGRFLATGGSDGVVEMWQVQGDKLSSTNTFVSSDISVGRVQWKNNNSLIVGKQFGREIDIWSLDAAIPVRHVYLEYPRVPSQIRAIDIVNDIVAVAPMSDGTGIPVGHNANIYLYQLPSLRQTTVLRGHHGTVYSAVFSHDGQWVVSGGDDGTVRLWQLAQESR